MGLRLILTRHAKSSWDDPRLDDVDRVLNARGQRSAAAIGRWLKERDYLPDQMLVSMAARARETSDWLSDGLGYCPQRHIVDALYLASPHRILSELRKATGQTVLLIGHNPGIGEFATEFALSPPLQGDFARYPTAATTVFDIAAQSWSQVAMGQNPVIDFVTPRPLLD